MINFNKNLHVQALLSLKGHHRQVPRRINQSHALFDKCNLNYK